MRLTCAAGSVLLFGSNYLPVKKYEVGDGFFFQWALCAGIWLVGVCIQLVHPYSSEPPPLVPLAVFGGAIWATGQLAVVTIVAVALVGVVVVRRRCRSRCRRCRRYRRHNARSAGRAHKVLRRLC